MLNFNIGDFLKRATNKQAQELYFRQSVKDVLKNKFDTDINFDAISLKGGVIYLKNISQAARMAIFIKKQQVLLELNNNQNIYKIIDIR